MKINTIVIGSDHAGFEYKEQIIAFLTEKNIKVLDVGTHGMASVDYPDYAHPVANQIESQAAQMGILICGSGNGVAITANKHPEIRAALCWNETVAALARQHNDANVLAIPARFVSLDEAFRMVEVFLETPFEGGRHATRVGKINCI